AVLSQVDSLRPAGQVSRWERPREIGQRERDRGMHSVLAPENDPERVAQETESRTEAAMQEANIVLLHECWLASENHDHRRRNLGLRGVVELHLTTGRLRRLPARQQLLQHHVHVCGVNALVPFGVHLEKKIEHLVNALAGESRTENER